MDLIKRPLPRTLGAEAYIYNKPLDINKRLKNEAHAEHFISVVFYLCECKAHFFTGDISGNLKMPHMDTKIIKNNI